MAECKRKRLPGKIKGKFSSKGRSSESVRMRQLNGKDKQINNKNIILKNILTLRKICEADVKMTLRYVTRQLFRQFRVDQFI